jgi:hypothetical protein
MTTVRALTYMRNPFDQSTIDRMEDKKERVSLVPISSHNPKDETPQFDVRTWVKEHNNAMDGDAKTLKGRLLLSCNSSALAHRFSFLIAAAAIPQHLRDIMRGEVEFRSRYDKSKAHGSLRRPSQFVLARGS